MGRQPGSAQASTGANREQSASADTAEAVTTVLLYGVAGGWPGKMVFTVGAGQGSNS
jgi:hypothetical protein